MDILRQFFYALIKIYTIFRLRKCTKELGDHAVTKEIMIELSSLKEERKQRARGAATSSEPAVLSLQHEVLRCRLVIRHAALTDPNGMHFNREKVRASLVSLDKEASSSVPSSMQVAAACFSRKAHKAISEPNGNTKVPSAMLQACDDLRCVMCNSCCLFTI